MLQQIPHSQTPFFLKEFAQKCIFENFSKILICKRFVSFKWKKCEFLKSDGEWVTKNTCLIKKNPLLSKKSKKSRKSKKSTTCFSQTPFFLKGICPKMHFWNFLQNFNL